jgi:hypothetical protein
MASKLDELLPTIIDAGDAGLSIGKLNAKFVGRSKAKERLDPLRKKLAVLVGEGAIRGPLKYGATQYFFAADRGPSIETAKEAIVAFVARSGVKLSSKVGLEKKVIGMNRRFFADGLGLAVASRDILELRCGSSRYYLHSEVAADYFGLSPISTDFAETSAAGSVLTFETLLPVYRRLKDRQGGFSAVKIFDLMRELRGSKEDLHRLLIEEARTGRVTIHPTTSVDLPAEVIEAGLRLPGFSEPFITVVIKNEP